MTFKSLVGIDFIDFAIQFGITAMIAVIADTASYGRSEGAIAAVVAISLGVLAWRRKRGLAQLPPATSGEVAALRLEELEQRLAELEGQQQRVLELEDRLDFAERLLAQQRDVARLPLGRTEDA